jgi:hypothetical protein
MELSGGVCDALAAGVLDGSRWLPEAVAALERRCALGGDALAGPPAPAPWAWPLALAVAGLTGATLAGSVAGGAGRRGD